MSANSLENVYSPAKMEDAFNKIKSGHMVTIYRGLQELEKIELTHEDLTCPSFKAEAPKILHFVKTELPVSGIWRWVIDKVVEKLEYWTSGHAANYLQAGIDDSSSKRFKKALVNLKGKHNYVPFSERAFRKWHGLPRPPAPKKTRRKRAEPKIEVVVPKPKASASLRPMPIYSVPIIFHIPLAAPALSLSPAHEPSPPETPIPEPRPRTSGLTRNTDDPWSHQNLDVPLSDDWFDEDGNLILEEM